MQGVVSLKDQPAAFEALRGLTQESSAIVTGSIHADKRAPGGFEIQIAAIEVVQRLPCRSSQSAYHLPLFLSISGTLAAPCAFRPYFVRVSCVE